MNARPPGDGADRATGLPVTAVNLPFLGSRAAPHTAFQYLLQEVDAAGAVIACPTWLVRREHLRVSDCVDFHLPFQASDGWHRQHGEIVEAGLDADGSGQVCRAVFRDRQPLHHPVHASVDTGEITFRDEDGRAIDRDELLVRLLHDCELRKRGVGVYFKHIVPLFSRITMFPTEDYGALRTMLLDDIQNRIAANVAAFSEWHERAASGARLLQDLDLEAVRAATEGEIDSDLLGATFDTPVIRPYIGAIRLLEQKLYLNFNTIVLLYAHAL